jgi:hypothetical protein
MFRIDTQVRTEWSGTNCFRLLVLQMIGSHSHTRRGSKLLTTAYGPGLLSALILTVKND